MSWSYDFTKLATSKKDQVRFKCGDTDPDYAYIPDEVIEFLLTENNDNVLNAAIKAVESIIRTLASQVDYKIGPESVSASDRSKQFQAVLKDLKAEAHLVTPWDLGSIETHAPIFKIGMDDFSGGDF